MKFNGFTYDMDSLFKNISNDILVNNLQATKISQLFDLSMSQEFTNISFSVLLQKVMNIIE